MRKAFRARRTRGFVIRRVTPYPRKRRGERFSPFSLRGKEKAAGGKKKAARGGVCVGTNSTSLAPPQAAGLVRFVVPPFPARIASLDSHGSPCPFAFPLKTTKEEASPLLGRFKGIPKKGLPRESSEAVRAGKGGTTKRTRPAACGGARDVEFVPTQIPLCHSFFRPSTALSFSCEKESGVETFPARCACGPGVTPPG